MINSGSPHPKLNLPKIRVSCYCDDFVEVRAGKLVRQCWAA